MTIGVNAFVCPCPSRMTNIGTNTHDPSPDLRRLVRHRTSTLSLRNKQNHHCESDSEPRAIVRRSELTCHLNGAEYHSFSFLSTLYCSFVNTSLKPWLLHGSDLESGTDWRQSIPNNAAFHGRLFGMDWKFGPPCQRS